MILLTGITGNIGGATARALLARGVRFRALVRDAQKAAAWAERGVELVVGNLEDAASITRALAGVDRALLVLPNGEPQEQLELAFIRTAREAGLPWLIKLSSPEAVRGTTSPIPLAHLAAEDALKASGMKWTLVRPSFYMQNFRGSIKAARETGKLSMPMGRGTVALTDNQEAGEFIAQVLTDVDSARHQGQCYDITGPDPVMDFEGIARVIGEVIGKPVSYPEGLSGSDPTVPSQPVALGCRGAPVRRDCQRRHAGASHRDLSGDHGTTGTFVPRVLADPGCVLRRHCAGRRPALRLAYRIGDRLAHRHMLTAHQPRCGPSSAPRQRLGEAMVIFRTFRLGGGQ